MSKTKRFLELMMTVYQKMKKTSREIQTIGIYTRNGLWYCEQ